MTPAAFRAVRHLLPDGPVSIFLTGCIRAFATGATIATLPETDEVIRVCREDRPDLFLDVSAIAGIRPATPRKRQ